MPLTPITSLEKLREYLYAGIQLEHATIPVYLTSLYSIHPGTNLDAVQILRVIVVEEMLHMTLASNMLNAVGGKVDLTQPGFVPTFPTPLPDGETDFLVDLQKFSPAALETFLKIERPAKAPSESGCFVKRAKHAGRMLPTMKSDSGEELHFYSIGEFYHAIQVGMEQLCAELGEDKVFFGNHEHQVTPEYYYSGGGEINPVYDLASAKVAIRMISEQGEGFEASILDFENEISHYYRFDQIKKGRYYKVSDEREKPTGDAVAVDWDAVYPIKTNATISDYPEGSEVKDAALSFNRGYKKFLADLTAAFNGKPELLIPAVGGMFRIKELASQLIRNPISDGSRLNAAPTFQMESVKTESLL